MREDDGMTEWNATHYFIHDSTSHNRFLVDYLKPETEQLEKEGLLDQYFYIVYWQGGNHVRFRYKSREPETVERRMNARFDSFLEGYEPKYVLPEKAYYELYSNNKENVEDITFIPDKSARRMVYEPETERYGGPRSLPHCEKIFSLSSKYTLGIRKNAGNSVMKRIIGGLDLFTLAVKGLRDREPFLSLYSQYWKGFAGENKKLFSTEELAEKYKKRHDSLMEDAGDYYRDWEMGLREEMEQVCETQSVYPDQDTAEKMILASQIHMTNNRLGIIPQMEAPLAEVLRICEGS